MITTPLVALNLAVATDAPTTPIMANAVKPTLRMSTELGRDEGTGQAMFLALEIIKLEKYKLDGRSAGFGVPYRLYVGIKTEFVDFIE